MLSCSEFQRSLHHFDLSRIDVSLLGSQHIYTPNRNPLAVSKFCGSQNGSESSPCIAEADLVSVILLMESIQLLQKVRGKNAPDCIIRISYLDTAGMLDKATVPSDMSLSLHIGCGFSPWCEGLAHLHLAGQASAEKNSFGLQEDGQSPPVVDTFPSCNWTLQELVQKMSFAVVSCLIGLGCQRAVEVTCREWRHILEATDSQWTCWKQKDLTWFEYAMMINQSCTSVISHYIHLDTFLGVISKAVMVCMT